MVPGYRALGWSTGVVISLVGPRRLEFSFMPSKSHRGRYGTELTTITLDPTIADSPAMERVLAGDVQQSDFAITPQALLHQANV